MSDQLTDFLLPQRGVRGAIAEINTGIDEMLGWRSYSADVRRLLTQAIAAMPLLASHAKFEGRINLQFQGKRALKLLVAQIDRELKVRGMAKAADDVAGDFAALMGGGLLALILEPDKAQQNYQAVVQIRGAGLAQALEAYFGQSEQLPTLIRVGASSERLAGVLLQRMPARKGADDDAHWQHVSALFATLGEPELAATDPLVLLRRLFQDEEVRVFEPRPLRLVCSCSHASISSMLLSLGASQIAPVLQEHGKIEVGCEFCGRTYTYTRGETEALFAAAAAEDNKVRH